MVRENRAIGEALRGCHSFDLGDQKSAVYGTGLEDNLWLREGIHDDISLDISGQVARITFSKSWAGAVFHLKIV